jgi:hypothetical protein
MATKKATTKKVSAKKKTVTVTVAETPVAVPQVGIQTWGNVMKTDMKKPHSWRDWQARQLDANRLK